MRQTFIIFCALLSLVIAAKFKLAQDYLISRKWIFSGAVYPPQIVILNIDGTVRQADNITQLERFTWKFNQAEQWLNVYDKYFQQNLEMNTVLLNKNQNIFPQVTLISYNGFTIMPKTVICNSYLREYHPENLPMIITKQLITSVPWTMNCGAKDGYHETVIFRSDGKVYQADNKTLREPPITYQTMDGYVKINILNGKYPEVYDVRTMLANNNPLSKQDLTLIGGQVIIQFPNHRFYLMYLSKANVRKFIINESFLFTKLWTLTFGSTDGLHQDIILNPNGKVYEKDNQTEVTSMSKWQFNEEQQWIIIQLHSSPQDTWNCTLNTVFINDNPYLYPDVTIFGDYKGIFKSKPGQFSTCSLSLSAQYSQQAMKPAIILQRQ